MVDKLTVDTRALLSDLRIKLDNIREDLDSRMYRSKDSFELYDTEEFKLLRQIYNGICQVEDMF